MDAAYEEPGQRGNWFFARFLSRPDSSALPLRRLLRVPVPAVDTSGGAKAPRAAGHDGLGAVRRRPSWTTDTTRCPSWVNTWPRARPRAPVADGDSCT